MVKRSNNTVDVIAFNNYHVRSDLVNATGAWDRGEGRHEVLPAKRGMCYHVNGYHKQTEPNSNSEWIASHMRISPDRTSVKFSPLQGMLRIGTQVKVARCKTDESGETCKDIE